MYKRLHFSAKMAYIFLVLIFAAALWNAAAAQEMIRNGGFEDDSEWTVYDMGSNEPSEVVFGYDGTIPTYGSGKCLEIFGGPSDYTNILVFQEVELIGGVAYKISAAFLDLTGDNLPEPEGFWCQLYFSEEEPVDGTDWTPPAGANTDYNLGFNSWSGCSGSGVDGTFQADACDGKNDTTFVAPGEPGQPVLVFVGIKTGVWGTQLEYDVAVDNFSLMGPNPVGVETDRDAVVGNFELRQNYPNPFNAGTTIGYTLSATQANSPVQLHIYDLRGQLVKTLVDGIQSTGAHHVQWDGTDANGNLLSSGMYVAKMTVGDAVRTIKLTSLK